MLRTLNKDTEHCFFNAVSPSGLGGIYRDTVGTGFSPVLRVKTLSDLSAHRPHHRR